MKFRDNKKGKGYIQYPNPNTGILMIGNQMFRGVITIDGEFACARCKVVNPDMELTGRGEDGEVFRCACGNQIVVQMPKYVGKESVLRFRE